MATLSHTFTRNIRFFGFGNPIKCHIENKTPNTNAGFKQLRTLTLIILEAIFNVAFALTIIVPEYKWNRADCKDCKQLKYDSVTPEEAYRRSR
jgi:hypothetical protein